MNTNLSSIVKPPVIVSQTVAVRSPVTVQMGGSSLGGAALWTGEGPPHVVVGSTIGDEYLDVLSGTLYRLDADYII